MKNKEYRNYKMKYKLLERKNRGVKYVIWSLRKDQIDYIESIGYSIQPYLFRVHTRVVDDVKNSAAIIKKVHYAKVRGKDILVTRLSYRERKILDGYEIYYKPCKYRIYL